MHNWRKYLGAMAVAVNLVHLESGGYPWFAYKICD